MSSPFVPLIGNLNNLGFYQFLFPFLLVLAIAYGVLEFALGGEKGKRILPKSAVAIVSMVIAFFVVNFSGGVGSGMALFFTQLFGQGMSIAVGILVIIILLGLFGIKPTDLKDKEKKPAMFVAIVGIIILIGFIMFIGSANTLGLSGLRLDNNAWTVIIFIIIFIGVMWALGREEGGGGKEEKK